MGKINKLYTKNGDKGTTHLVGGDRIEKCSIRVDAIGDIDELNAYLGLVRTVLETKYNRSLVELLLILQSDVFNIGNIIATSPSLFTDAIKVITEENINFLENWIDKLCESIPELNSCVVPGGTILNSYLHIARTVCRRAERSIWLLNSLHSLEVEDANRWDKNLPIYLNRLSDLLFALSRYDIFDSEKIEHVFNR